MDFDDSYSEFLGFKSIRIIVFQKTEEGNNKSTEKKIYYVNCF